MSITGLEGIERTVHVTHVWINELDLRLGWSNKGRSYRLLRTVLHAIRDVLPHDESADFAAQLPALLRGVYYEQWRPSTTPTKTRSRADFLARVDATFKNDPLEDSAQAVIAVFEFLSSKIAAGEVGDIRHAIPRELRTLWPERYISAGAVR